MEFSSYQENTNGEGNMTSYYLLRKNQESGPYTLKELKTLPLYKTDLLWVNGESTSWNHPDEIEDLKGVAREPEVPTPVRRQPSTTAASETEVEKAFVYAVPTSQSRSEQNLFNADDNENSKPSFDELQKKYSERKPLKKVWEKPLHIGANLVGLTTLVLGLTASAYMVKKAVDNIEFEPISATADAKLIEPQVVASSSTSHAAMSTASMLPEDQSQMIEVSSEPPPETTHNENVALPAIPVVATDSQKANLEVGIPTEVDANSQVFEPETQAEFAANKSTDEKNDATQAEEKAISKTSLQINANNYSVGFLGGISNLELSVGNQSAKAVHRAVVEIEYLKANGKVLGSQTVEVSGIAPGTSKKISVPDYGRGVNVRYKVVTVEG